MSHVSMPVQPPNQQFNQGLQDAPVAPDGQQIPTNAPVYGQPVPPPVAPSQVPPGYFTAADLERVRQEEKNKLYGKISTVEQQLAEFKSERETAAAAIRAQQDAEADAQRRAAEEELSVRELLARRETELTAQMAKLQAEREQDRLLFAKEQKFNELQQYIQRRSKEETDNIEPNLLDFIDGNSPEEVEARIVLLRQKSEAIVQNMSQAQIEARAQQRGVSTAGYASAGGPMEDHSQQKTITAEELAAMPMSEYAKHRGSLLGRGSQAPRGMFG